MRRAAICAAWIFAAPAFAVEVATLAQEIGAPNVAVRREAAYTLDRMGAGAKDAVPALIGALDDSDKQVWSFAISALANIGPEAKAAVPALIEGFGSRRRGRDRDRRQVQTRAAFALSRIGAAAIPALIEALKTDDDGLRAGAAKALAGMGAEAGAAIPALIANLKGDDEVRREVVEALGAIGAVKPLAEALQSADSRTGAALALAIAGSSAKEAAPAILDLLKKETDVPTRIALLSALPKIGADPQQAVPLLVDGVKDENEQVRHAAVNALVPMRAVALPALTALLKDDNAAVRQRAGRALGRMGPDAAPAVPALIDAARKSPSDSAIANALAEIGPAALPAVLAALREASAADADRLLGLLRGFGAPAVPVLIEALKHPTGPVRAAAARALGGMGREAKAAIDPLFAQAAEADAPGRAAALRALVALEANADRLKPMLEIAMKDAVPEVRRAGAGGLASSGGANALGVVGLVELLDDEDPASRKSAVDGLGSMGVSAAAAVPALMERLDDAILQIPAAVALGKIGHAAAPAVPRLIALGKDGAVPLRVAAFTALAGIGREASTALPAVYAAMRDNDPDVRISATQALPVIESDDAKILAALLPGLGDDSGRVRRPTAAALSKFGERARAATSGLVTMLERDNDRGVALLALKVIGVRSVPDLLRALSMKEPQVRVFACEQLAALGTDARDAAPRLKELTTDQPQAVKEAALAALAKMAPAQ